MSPVETPNGTPRYSMVVAVYNVAKYLGEFIDSIEGQTLPLHRLQVIVVDDGSTDDSLKILETWQRRRPELVTVISQPNAGAAAARNAGLARVTGDWVTFTDPDDVLDKGYFAEVDAFLRKRPKAMMVATNRAVFSDLTGLPVQNPLRRHFVTGNNRLRDLNIDTGHFHGHAASTFFRVDEIERGNIRYDERLRATFEDGHFCCVYLLHVAQPLVAYLPDAIYHYRKRDDGSSQLDQSWINPSRFTDNLEHGYLALLRQSAERYGRAPSWLQGMVIYELSWYLKMNDRLTAPTAAFGETRVRYHELMKQICELLDDAGIETYRATALPAAHRQMLEHGYREEAWNTPYAVVDKLDNDQRLMRVYYRFKGEPPTEEFAVYSKFVSPVHHKVRDVRLFGRTMLYERIVWLPFGTLRVILNGRDVEVRTAEPRPPDHRLPSAMILKGLTSDQDAVVAKPKEERPSLADRMIVRLSRTKLVRRYFGGAWVLIDRVFNADDSAEHLFRYLRTHRRHINAWFVIERGTPDFRRLRRDGFLRVVPHGSFAWKLLMLNAAHLISSHADDAVVRPRAIRDLVEPQWRLTFLQHGIIKDDLSTWLDRKNIDVFVTSTRAELSSIVGDGTTYRYTTKEVKLTGLPRFDRVLAEGKRFPPKKRDLILVAPTWRQWLSTSEPVVTGRHTVDPEDFRTSQFAQEWTQVINSPELAELAERSGLKVALLMHPNWQDAARFDTMPHVQELTFEGQNVQEVFARARVLVTDYSSMFFNAAYIDRPIVYFQFDRDLINAGWHTGRGGYFDYERDGFGPVTLTVEEAVAAITKTVESGAEPDPVYLERIRAAFPKRDGRCCERVADAIVESTRPIGPPARKSVAPAPPAGPVRRLMRLTAHQLRR